ncbi:MAG: hypothetical protein EOO90_04270 [Pedobacter sp.]|nr:MAG: hypothetical protein EOO90_04270 [Pedobacter sp.]
MNKQHGLNKEAEEKSSPSKTNEQRNDKFPENSEKKSEQREDEGGSPTSDEDSVLARVNGGPADIDE